MRRRIESLQVPGRMYDWDELLLPLKEYSVTTPCKRLEQLRLNRTRNLTGLPLSLMVEGPRSAHRDPLTPMEDPLAAGEDSPCSDPERSSTL